MRIEPSRERLFDIVDRRIFKNRSVGLSTTVNHGSSMGKSEAIFNAFASCGKTETNMLWLHERLAEWDWDPNWVPTTSRLANSIRWANRSHLRNQI